MILPALLFYPARGTSTSPKWSKSPFACSDYPARPSLAALLLLKWLWPYSCFSDTNSPHDLVSHLGQLIVQSSPTFFHVSNPALKRYKVRCCFI